MTVAGLFAPVDFHTHGPVLPPVQPTDAWYQVFDANRDYPMPPQLRDWTCSICSVDWVALATGLDPTSSREKVGVAMARDRVLGECVNSSVGLLDAACAGRYMQGWGIQTQHEWITWERAVEICGSTTGILNSLRWQHYVAIRGMTSDGQLWIANSALGWMNIYSTISQWQFNQWAGTWQTVFLSR